MSNWVGHLIMLHSKVSNLGLFRNLTNMPIQNTLAYVLQSMTKEKKALWHWPQELLRVNGTPLMDISLDLSPRNSSKYIGVIRVPQRAALLPRLVQSKKDMLSFNKWVSPRSFSGSNFFHDNIWHHNTHYWYCVLSLYGTENISKFRQMFGKQNYFLLWDICSKTSNLQSSIVTFSTLWVN